MPSVNSGNTNNQYKRKPSKKIHTVKILPSTKQGKKNSKHNNKRPRKKRGNAKKSEESSIVSVEVCVREGKGYAYEEEVSPEYYEWVEKCNDLCPQIEENRIVNTDSLEAMMCLKDDSVKAVITSPPYADKRKDQYGGVPPEKYVEWFKPFAKQIKRILREDGFFMLNIKEGHRNGLLETYVYDLVDTLTKEIGFGLADELIWVKNNPVPVGNHGYYLKNSYERIYQFVKKPKARLHIENVSQPINKKTIERCERVLRNNKKENKNKFVSIRKRAYCERLMKNPNKKVAPPNIVIAPKNTTSWHPAPMSKQLTEFLVKLTTNEQDLVIDPFAGGGTTCKEAVKNNRKCIGFEIMKEYAVTADKELQELIQ